MENQFMDNLNNLKMPTKRPANFAGLFYYYDYDGLASTCNIDSGDCIVIDNNYTNFLVNYPAEP